MILKSIFALVLWLLIVQTQTTGGVSKLPTSPQPGGPNFEPLEYHHWNINPYFYTRGYRLGYFIDSSIKGFFVKTVEGGLQLGFDSTDTRIQDEGCLRREEDKIRRMANASDRVLAFAQSQLKCQRIINPWRFSTRSLANQYEFQKFKSTPVLVYYKGYRFVFFTQTHEIIEKAWPVFADRPLTRTYIDRLDHFPVSRIVHFGKGTLEGRIVRAAVEGNIRESYAVTIQVGPSGNNFVDMNVATTDVFNFIVEAMATGRYLRISYLELYNLAEWPVVLVRNYSTNFRIYRIDLLEK